MKNIIMHFCLGFTIVTVIGDALAQSPTAFLVSQYVSGGTRTCLYSDGTRFDIDARSRCAAVLY